MADKQLLINGEQVAHVSNIEWADDLESVANTINFTADEQFKCGSTFALLDGTSEILTGVITTYTQNKADEFSYSGYDFGFYLNKNSIIKQFNQAKIADAFKILCNDFNIPLGSIPELNTTVKKIYKNVVLADIFKEFLDLNKTKTGQDYFYFTCADGKFNVKKYEYIEGLTANIGDYFSANVNDTLHSPSISVSMEELKNRVIVTDNASDKVSKQIIASDDENINKYGLLQHIEEVDTDKVNNLQNVAKTKLAELNKLTTTIDLSMLGDFRMHKGIVMPVTNDKLQIDGDFLIKSSKHSITHTKEVVTVALQRYDKGKLN